MAEFSAGKGGPRIRVDLRKAVALAGPFIIGAIKTRTNRGVDVNGRPFEGYSPSYKRTLRRGGEGTKVDLRVTGTLLSALTTRRQHIGPAGPRGPETASVWVGIGAGKAQRVQHKDGKTTRLGSSDATLRQLAFWLQTGANGQPRRRFIGLTREEAISLVAEMFKLGVFTVSAGR